MTYADQAALAVNAAFRDRVKVATVTAAVAIQGEAVGAFSEQEYQKRQKLSSKVLINPGGQLESFVWAVVQNAAITSSSTDGDIQFTVNSVGDDIAGVDAGD